MISRLTIILLLLLSISGCASQGIDFDDYDTREVFKRTDRDAQGGT